MGKVYDVWLIHFWQFLVYYAWLNFKFYWVLRIWICNFYPLPMKIPHMRTVLYTWLVYHSNVIKWLQNYNFYCSIFHKRKNHSKIVKIKLHFFRNKIAQIHSREDKHWWQQQIYIIQIHTRNKDQFIFIAVNIWLNLYSRGKKTCYFHLLYSHFPSYNGTIKLPHRR